MYSFFNKNKLLLRCIKLPAVFQLLVGRLYNWKNMFLKLVPDSLKSNLKTINLPVDLLLNENIST